MASSAISPKSSHSLAHFQAAPPVNIPSKKECYEIALEIFEVFGHEYAEAILEKLPGKLKERCEKIHAACLEIQERLKEGDHNDGLWEQTSAVCIDIGGNRHSVVNRLKRISYGFLSFPQKILLQYKNPELSFFTKLETEYENGLKSLTEYLTPQSLADYKGIALPDDDLPMIKLCLKGGALVSNNKVYYFSDMVFMWAYLSPQDTEKRLAFFKRLPGEDWIQVSKKDNLELRTFHPSINQTKLSLKQSVSLSSMKAVSVNLCPRHLLPMHWEFFLPPVQEKFYNWFLESETLRSDLCFFSADRRSLYEYDFTNFDRTSKFLLKTIQFFFFLAGNFMIPDQEKPALFNILVFMKFDLNKIDNAGFRKRKWTPPFSERVTGDEVQSFQHAWYGLQGILTLIARREVSFSSPAEEDLEFFCDPNCWNLLFFLWKHPERELFVTFFERLVKILNVQLTLSSVLDFCKHNKAFTGKQAECFLIVTQLVWGVLLKRGVEVSHPADLFFSPAYEFGAADVETYYGYAEGQTMAFLDKIGSDRFKGKEKELCLMIRNYIVFPQPFLSDLLNDCVEIGAKLTPDLLIHVFTKAHSPWIVPSDVRAVATKFTKTMVEKSDFTDVEIWELYLTVLDAIMEGHWVQIQKVQKAILTLQSFCPRLSAGSCIFLIRYPAKEMVLNHANCLKEAWDEWVKDDDEDLDRFVINQQKYANTLQEIQHFALGLSKACPPPDLEHRGLRFCESLKLEIFSGLYTSAQPLTDFLYIGGLSSDGIEWINLHLKTHEGQLLYLDYSAVSLYLNWQVFNDRPVLFMFYKKGEKTASAFLVLDVSAEKVSIKEIKGPFYVLLSRLAQEVLLEEASEVPNAAAPESWVLAYTGASQTIKDSGLGPEFVEPIQRFLSELKRKYRQLYLRVIANPEPHQEFPEDLEERATLGIFESNGRMSLLPEDPVAHPEHFSPDADLDQIEALRGLFSQSTEKQPLNLNLRTTGGDFPIFYQVQSKGEWIDDPQDQGDEAGKYVTLFCDEIPYNKIRIPLIYSLDVLADPVEFADRFKGHILFAKMAYYCQKTME